MKDDIAEVRDSLLRIVDRLRSRMQDMVLRFAIVAYRDHPPQDATYVTRVFDFTDDIRKVHQTISRLDVSEGGDEPEAVADGLFDARTKLRWARDAYKVLLLIGDAPPHGKKYSGLSHDYWPEGCPAGHDPIDELRALKNEYGTTIFLAICGCNPRVEPSFKAIAESVEGGQYYSLAEVHRLPDTILEILESISDLMEEDLRVLRYYESHDGVLDIPSAASELNMQVRDLRVSLSRLLELGRIPSWPRGRPLTPEATRLAVEPGVVPDAILSGKAFKYALEVDNPSAATVGLRLVVTLSDADGVTEVTNELHEIAPRFRGRIETELVPMTPTKSRATLHVKVYQGSKMVVSRDYQTRVY